MKAGRWWFLFLMAALTGPLMAQQMAQSTAGVPDRERLIGAWRLVRIDSAGPDGTPAATGQPRGMLIYTRDGHVSVQLMYPKSAAALSNEYVKNGYEASFGSFTVDESRHTVTHSIMGSNTGDALLGKDLPRRYEFTPEGKLRIRPVNSQEHWSVLWEHY
jgi:hypothetical protein